ncbi:MAG: peptidoglycan-binding protein [Ilumatobacteraceae bacterium]
MPVRRRASALSLILAVAAGASACSTASGSGSAPGAAPVQTPLATLSTAPSSPTTLALLVDPDGTGNVAPPSRRRPTCRRRPRPRLPRRPRLRRRLRPPPRRRSTPTPGSPAAPPAVPIPAVGSADGAATEVVQQRLLDLGFWLSAVDGQYGLTTRQAVMAFQKYNLLEATGEVDQATADAMGAQPIRAVGVARTGDLVEVDKERQLLFIIRSGITLWVLNCSTGNGLPYEEEDQNSPGEIVRDVALTPDGEFKVNRQREEGWWEGDLGKIYRPKYFTGGIAVHGSGNIPNYPASHGCVRVSVPAMDYIWAHDLMPMKSKVWVHS